MRLLMACIFLSGCLAPACGLLAEGSGVDSLFIEPPTDAVFYQDTGADTYYAIEPVPSPRFTLDDTTTSARDTPNAKSATVPQPVDTLPDIPVADAWRFQVVLGAWVPFEWRGTISTSATETQFGLDLGDVLDDLNWFIEGGMELTNDNWSILFWGFGFELESGDHSTRTFLGEFDTTLKLQVNALDLAVMKKVGAWQVGGSPIQELNLDAGIGGRYWHLEVDIEEDGPFGGSANDRQNADWVDPYVGGRLRYRHSEKTHASLRADIGGFDIGDSSKLTWTATAIVTHKVKDNAKLVLGYRYLDIDWSTGDLEMDMYVHGPIAGLVIRF